MIHLIYPHTCKSCLSYFPWILFTLQFPGVNVKTQFNRDESLEAQVLNLLVFFFFKIARNCLGMAVKLNTCQEAAIFEDEREGKIREVGNQAVWSLSSCKPGFGVEQLRDEDFDTYWQSDGPQPHLVNVQFRRKTIIQDICLYTNYKADESYTPNRISIRAGNNFHDLVELEQVELIEPVGWVKIPLKDTNDKHIRTFMIQIAVLSNHQNGRDTHIRRIKVRSPVMDTSIHPAPKFTSPEMIQYAYFK